MQAFDAVHPETHAVKTRTVALGMCHQHTSSESPTSSKDYAPRPVHCQSSSPFPSLLWGWFCEGQRMTSWICGCGESLKTSLPPPFSFFLFSFVSSQQLCCDLDKSCHGGGTVQPHCHLELLERQAAPAVSTCRPLQQANGSMCEVTWSLAIEAQTPSKMKRPARGPR